MGRTYKRPKAPNQGALRLRDRIRGQDVPEDVRLMIVGHANPDVHKIYSHDEETAIKSAILKLPKLTA